MELRSCSCGGRKGEKESDEWGARESSSTKFQGCQAHLCQPALFLAAFVVGGGGARSIAGLALIVAVFPSGLFFGINPGSRSLLRLDPGRNGRCGCMWATDVGGI
jgi:hypothetical protein